MKDDTNISGEANPKPFQTTGLKIVSGKSWRDQLDDRETAKIDHAICYSENFSSAGISGHSDLLLLAKLVRLLDQGG